MGKIYKVNVVSVDPETNEEEQVLEDSYAGFLLLADCGDGRMAEVIVHDTILGIANKLAQGKKTRDAVRLARTLMEMGQDATECAENTLMRAIMGGFEDE